MPAGDVRAHNRLKKSTSWEDGGRRRGSKSDGVLSGYCARLSVSFEVQVTSIAIRARWHSEEMYVLMPTSKWSSNTSFSWEKDYEIPLHSLNELIACEYFKRKILYKVQPFCVFENCNSWSFSSNNFALLRFIWLLTFCVISMFLNLVNSLREPNSFLVIYLWLFIVWNSSKQLYLHILTTSFKWCFAFLNFVYNSFSFICFTHYVYFDLWCGYSFV